MTTATLTLPPWSFSSLTSFESCPKRYYHIKVAKDIVETQHEATLWGTTVHTHLENRVRDNTPLPASLADYELLVNTVTGRGGDVLVEKELAVSATFDPSPWTGGDAWCRGIVDLGVLTGKRGVLLDWKTGKRKPDLDQLKLFAALAFSHYPELEEVQTGFVWLKVGKVDKQTYRRDDVPMIWNQFIPRVKRRDDAYASATFPPRPSGLCNGWCPVPHSKCKFSSKP